MVVEATYTDGTITDVTGYTWAPTIMSEDVESVTISYAEGRVTATAIQPVSVAETVITVTVPYVSGTLTYNGSVQQPVWVDFDQTNTDISGDVEGTDAKTYTATFTLHDKCAWVTGGNEPKDIQWTINKATVETVPTQSGTLTYNTQTQRPAWNGYNEAELTIDGATEGVDAKTYTATFTPTANYQWSNGGVEAREAAWTIAKAPGKVIVTPTTVTLDADHTSIDVTVDRLGDGKITATVEDDTVASVAVDGNTVTVSAVEKGPSDGSSLSDTNEEPLYYNSGTTNVTVSVAEGGNYTTPVDAKVEVNADFKKETEASNIPVGDEVVLNVDGTPTRFIVVQQGKPDPDMYDDSCDGTWLLMKDCWGSRAWDSTSNNNDYSKSAINTWLNKDFLNLFDDNIKNTIETIKIPYRVGSGKGSDVYTGADGLSVKAFLLGGYEVGFTINDYASLPIDGAKLSYFISGEDTEENNKRIAYYKEKASRWALRSADTKSTLNTMWSVMTNGAGASSGTSNTYYIRPCIIFPSDYEFTPDQYGPTATIAALKAEVNQLRVALSESRDEMTQIRADTDYIAVMQGVTL